MQGDNCRETIAAIMVSHDQPSWLAIMVRHAAIMVSHHGQP